MKFRYQKALQLMCMAEFKTHSFSAPPCWKITPCGEGGGIAGLVRQHTLPVLEFRSSVPVDATTFKKSGNSRNPKPQKSTCMIVHVQRRAAACVPIVILYSSGHSGLSASGPPATSNFYYPRLFSICPLAGEVHCWDVSASRNPWRTCILQTGVGCSKTVNCDGLRCKKKPVHQLSPQLGAGSARQGTLGLQ